MIKIFKFFKRYINKDLDYNCFKKYEPEKVIENFKTICLEPKNKSNFYLFKEFLYDLPWELYVPLKISIKNITFSFIKILPTKIKIIIKFIINKS